MWRVFFTASIVYVHTCSAILLSCSGDTHACTHRHTDAQRALMSNAHKYLLRHMSMHTHTSTSVAPCVFLQPPPAAPRKRLVSSVVVKDKPSKVCVYVCVCVCVCVYVCVCVCVCVRAY